MITVMGLRALYRGWQLGSHGPQTRHVHGATSHTHAVSGDTFTSGR